MNLILEKAAFYGFNQRQLTERDFYKICEAEQVGVEWTDTDLSWFMTIDHKPYIVLPKKMNGLKLAFKMFHEVGHLICHAGLAPNVAFFHGDKDTKAEREADALALIALIPRKDIYAPKLDDSRYARLITRERHRLAFLFNV